VGRWRRSRPLTVLVGCLLAAGVGVVEVLYRMPPVPFDQVNYFDAAWGFPSHSSYISEHQLLRHGLTVPIRFAQELFGYSQAAYLAVPILAGVLLAVSVYVLGLLLFNRTVGVAAAVLTVGNSTVFASLTTPLPDTLATALMCAALAVALALRQRRLLVTSTRVRQIVALLLVGTLLGWSYLAREYMVFCWPLVALMLVRRVRLIRLGWLALPVVLIVAGESLLNAVAYGDPLARLHVAAHHGDGPPLSDEPWRNEHLGRSPQWYLTRLAAIVGAAPEALWLKAAIAATVIGAFFHRKIGFLLAWALLFYVPLVTLGGLLDPYHPRLRINVQRYWLPLIPALCLAFVAVVWLLVGNRARVVPFLRRRTRLCSVIASLAVLAAVAVPVGIAQHARDTGLTDPYTRYAANGATELEDFRSWLRTGSVDTLWANPSTNRVVKIFLNPTFGRPAWDGELKVWHRVDEPRPGDHVLLYSARTATCGSCMLHAQNILGKPLRIPASWRLVFQANDRQVEVYRVR
jgi:4-amino-4-deoxy-L-arabinose transferase-like glycosyltransferase